MLSSYSRGISHTPKWSECVRMLYTTTQPQIIYFIYLLVLKKIIVCLLSSDLKSFLLKLNQALIIPRNTANSVEFEDLTVY
jgi:hypothetical protein